jgi:hypothetical protein
MKPTKTVMPQREAFCSTVGGGGGVGLVERNLVGTSHNMELKSLYNPVFGKY